jgi:uncharacterized protein (DUF885 family)
MSSRTTAFFMTPEEFDEFVKEVRAEVRCYVLVESWPPLHLEMMRGSALRTLQGKPARILFFSRTPVDVGQLNPLTFNATQLGWVNCTAPKVAGNVLVEADIGSRSDWYELKTRTVHENPGAHALFAKIRPLLLKRLRRPMWLTAQGGGWSRLVRTVGYTVGAAEWVKKGGVLGTSETGGMRYVLSDPGLPDVGPPTSGRSEPQRPSYVILRGDPKDWATLMTRRDPC